MIYRPGAVPAFTGEHELPQLQPDAREAKLRRWLGRYRALYNNTPVMMHSIDEGGHIVSVNDHWLHVLQYERHEVLGRLSTDFLTPEARHQALTVFMPQLRQVGRVHDVELEFQRKDGQRIDVLLSSIWETGADGEAQSFAFAVDVTEKRRAQQVIEARERRYRRLVEHASDAFFLLDEYGEILDVSDRACVQLGVSSRELIYRSLSELVLPEEADVVRRVLRSHTPRPPVTLEATLVQSSGPGHPVELCVDTFSEDGQILQVALARSIAERRRQVAEHKRSESQLTAVLRSAMDAIVIVQPDGVIQVLNEAAARLFGASPSEAVGRRIGEFVSAEFRDTLERFVADAQAGGALKRLLPGDLTAQRTTGESVPVEGTVSFVTPHDDSLCLLVLRDVHERRLAQQEIERLTLETVYLRDALPEEASDTFVGVSPTAVQVRETIRAVCRSTTPVLIRGATGTGKDLVARAVHRQGDRQSQPLVTVRCGAIPPALLEGELFGYEDGVIDPGAASRAGRFHLADGGALLLVEVDELPLQAQAQLLRVVEEGSFERVGGRTTQCVDVRILATTSRDLEHLVREGQFREDLFYRLGAGTIYLPPLRNRKTDIPPLVRHFAAKSAATEGKRIDTVPQGVIEILTHYRWPGNVRELANVIERAVMVSRGPDLELTWWLSDTGESMQTWKVPTLDEVQRAHIVDVLNLTSWKVSGPGGAAEYLGLKPTTLEARMKKLGITRQAAG